MAQMARGGINRAIRCYCANSAALGERAASHFSGKSAQTAILM